MVDEKTKKQWTILELIQWTTHYFQSKGIQSPRLTAELLLAYTLGVERISLYTHYDKPLNSRELAAFKENIQRRIRREPTQYITGKQEFWSMTFKVTPDVLIPRPETELLVETALRLFKQPARTTDPLSGSLTLADIGTGSGNIAIALAKELKNCVIYASDISEKALEVARYNAKNLLENPDQIIFLKGDLLQPFEKPDSSQAEGLKARSPYREGTGSSNKVKFNGILCNPPYISEKEYATLAPEVGQYEPKIALLGGKDGLSYYRRLFSTSAEYLFTQGYLILEIGFGQKEAILQMIERASGLTLQEIVKDYAGIDRVVVARKVGDTRP
jgi:release factor glutamine methyltransferase